MFSKVLECPRCSSRFNYEYTDQLPENITCPECHASADYEEFFAIILCPQCSKKLKIPLDMMSDPDLQCPKCDTPLAMADAIYDDDISGSTLSMQKQPRHFKQLLNEGDVFDKYKIIRLLGRGGMAEVYLAEHLLLKQKCAIKLMQRGLAADDPVFAKRFVREAKLTHSFNHPNIVRVFDAGSDFKTGYLFLAMEYVEGESLQELSGKKTFSESELLEIMFFMAVALQNLNEAGVVHRDIKPSNIMKTADGVYKLMDLGIAKANSGAVDGELTLTMEQSCIGTPGYASPEQCRSAHNADIRSDIYCLGATIYHLASGVMPFDGDTPVEIILKVMQQEPEPLRTYRPDLSLNLINLVEKMMKKNPDERPATPEELLTELYAKSSILMVIKNKLTLFASFILRKNQFLGGLKVTRCLKFLLKSFVVLLLLCVLAVTGIYIFNYYDSGSDFVSYGVFLNRVFQKQSAEPPKRVFRNYEHYKTLRVHSDLKDYKRIQPVHGAAGAEGGFLPYYLVSDHAGDIVFDTVFDEPPRRSKNVSVSIPKHWIKDGVMHVGKPAKKEIKRVSQDGKVKMRTVYGRESGELIYFNTGGKANGFSLSLNLNVDKTDHAILFQIYRTISLQLNDGQLELVIQSLDNSKYKAVIPFGIQFGKWFNLTVSINKERHKISLFSGECFLGSYQLPENFSLWPHSVSFRSIGEVPIFTGKISRLTLYNTGLDFLLSPPWYPKFATVKFSDSRNVQLPEMWESFSIDQRLKDRRIRLQELRKNDNLPYQKEAVAYVSRQIRELNKQREIKQNIAEAWKKEYSYRAMLSFRKEFEPLAEKNLGGINVKNFKQLNRLFRFFQKNNIDPNIMLSDPKDKQKDCYFLDLVIRYDMPLKNQFLPLLLERFADVNKCKASDIPIKVLMSGRDDVNGVYPGYLFKIFYTPLRNPEKQFVIGKFYDIALLRDFLYVSPRIDGKDEKGRNLMHLAAACDDGELVKELMYSGFTGGTASDNNGLTPWQTALMHGSDKALNALASMNLKTDHAPEIQNQYNFIKALSSGKTQEAEKYLKAGADASQLWFNGLNALQNACFANDLPAVKMLLKNKVDPNNNIDFFHRRESHVINHPAYIAIAVGNAEMLKLLLTNGIVTENYNLSFSFDGDDLACFALFRMREDQDEKIILSLFEVLKKYYKNFDWNRRYRNQTSLLSLMFTTYRYTRISISQDGKNELIRYLLHNGAQIDKGSISSANQELLNTLRADKKPFALTTQLPQKVNWSKPFIPPPPPRR